VKFPQRLSLTAAEKLKSDLEADPENALAIEANDLDFLKPPVKCA
jgi:hypothetical protein